MRGGMREKRKGNRRAEQLAKLNEKMEAEAEFFWQCAKRKTARLKSDPQDLFSSQTASGINFDQYDAIEVSRSGNNCDQVKEVNGFSDIIELLPVKIAANIKRMGYEKPTPIQKHSIPLVLKAHRDVMCSAQTGSGKTCAFLLPTIALLDESSNSHSAEDLRAKPRILVLAPTRELAQQIHLESLKICFGTELRCVCVYGGSSARPQLESLADRVDVLVATPGRLTDFVDRNLVTLECIKFLVLDEADRMLDMGFEPQIRRIVERSNLPAKEKRGTLMFSATFPASIQKLAGNFMNNYVWIAVGRVGSSSGSITQRIIRSSPGKQAKFQLFMEQLKHVEGRTLVFVQKKHQASWFCRKLRKDFEIAATEIHGDRSQPQREKALSDFRNGVCDIMVATDVAARGLDVPDVLHVINVDMPVSAEDFDSYVHRIGRTGRAGNKGIATSLYVPGVDEGNGKLWPLLHQLLTECEQEIPEWFLALPEARNTSSTAKKSAPAKDARRSKPATHIAVQHRKPSVASLLNPQDSFLKKPFNDKRSSNSSVPNNNNARRGGRGQSRGNKRGAPRHSEKRSKPEE